MNKFALFAIVAALFVACAVANEDDAFVNWADEASVEWAEMDLQEMSKRSLAGGYYSPPEATIVPAPGCTTAKPVFCEAFANDDTKKCQTTVAACNTATENAISSCVAPKSLCSDGACKDSCITAATQADACPTAALPTLCYNNTCAANLGGCPAKPACSGSNIKCADGSCDTAANCAGKTLTCNSGSLTKKCEGAATCVLPTQSCPNYFGCPAGQTQCDNGDCSSDCAAVMAALKTSSGCTAAQDACYNGTCAASGACPVYPANNKKITIAGVTLTITLPTGNNTVAVCAPSADGTNTKAQCMNLGANSFTASSFSANFRALNSSNVTYKSSAMPTNVLAEANYPGDNSNKTKYYLSSPSEVNVTGGTISGTVDICQDVTDATAVTTGDKNKTCLAYMKTDNKNWTCQSAVSVGSSASNFCGSTNHLSYWVILDSSNLSTSGVASIAASAALSVVFVAFAMFM